MPAMVFGNAQSLHVLLTFDKVHNPLRLPRETTSELQKWLEHVVFNFLTSKCASRHNGVHFQGLGKADAPSNTKADTSRKH